MPRAEQGPGDSATACASPGRAGGQAVRDEYCGRSNKTCRYAQVTEVHRTGRAKDEAWTSETQAMFDNAGHIDDEIVTDPGPVLTHCGLSAAAARLGLKTSHK